MRRVSAVFDDAADAAAARAALRDAGLEPPPESGEPASDDDGSRVEPGVENAFFDPTVDVPEARGWVIGGLVGGAIGAVVLFLFSQYVFWLPRVSPIMTADTYALVFLGLGAGVASGGFVGGVIGTYRELPDPARLRVVVTVPDHRAGAVTDRLRDEGATTVETTVTHHEHPQRERATNRRRG